MRVLVLSDIHGNVHALQAVLRAAGDVDAVWNLGDAVGYGARPNEVLDCLRDLHAENVRGNHDRVCAGLTSAAGFNPVATAAVAWTRAVLTAENRAWLRGWAQGPLPLADRVLCAHGSPLDEDTYIVSMRDAFQPLQRMGCEIAFFGHTHVQGGFTQHGSEWFEERPDVPDGADAAGVSVDVTPGSRHLFNPGSVGQPRDGDARAAFVIYDTVEETVTFQRVAYDVAAAQAAIRQAGLPERLASRLAGGR